MSAAAERTPVTGADPGRHGSGTVAALGEPALLAGFRLAGAVLYPASGAAEVRAAWSALPETVGAVLLTPAAARVLAGELADSTAPLTAVLPHATPHTGPGPGPLAPTVLPR